MDAIQPQRSFSVPITNGAEPVYAGFWLRAGAFLIDFLLLNIAFIITIILLMILFSISDDTLKLLENRVFPLFIFLYYDLMESSSWQATLGKRVFGIKVTDINGNRISSWRANGRMLAKILSGLTLGVGYIMIVFTKRKQGLHDIIAGTLVVKAKS